jgi:hypothetical protein
MNYISLTNDLKARRYMAKLLWLVKVVGSCGKSLEEPLNQALLANYRKIPPTNLLFWYASFFYYKIMCKIFRLNALALDIKQGVGGSMIELLNIASKAFPLQMLYALRFALGSQVVTEQILEAASRIGIQTELVRVSESALRASSAKSTSKSSPTEESRSSSESPEDKQLQEEQPAMLTAFAQLAASEGSSNGKQIIFGYHSNYIVYFI